jgi:hypothetical protein
VSEKSDKDFWVEPLKRLVEKDRDIFWDKKFANGGFTQMYMQFYNIIFKEAFYLKHRK